jgi:thiol-disulfide isomerase/thioredoxin
MAKKNGKKPGKKPNILAENVPEKGGDNGGADQPDKKIPIAVVLLALVVLGCVVIFGSSLLNTSPSPELSGNKTNASFTATYFYGNGCSHCEKIKPLITDIQARYPELYIERLEINDNRNNLNTFRTMGSQYGLASSALVIPTIFIGENVLVGETEIMDHFEENILAEIQRVATGNPPK